MNHLSISYCSSPEDAIKRGYVYRKPEWQPVTLNAVVVVKNGMQSGAPTIDLLLTDENGQKYAALVPASLLATAFNGIPRHDQ